MKSIIWLVSCILLTGCVFGTSKEIQRAEMLLTQFECNNVESTQIARSSITTFHEQALYGAKQKATSYIESYKDGETLFEIGLDEVIEQQYLIYKEACQSLGGVSAEIKNEEQ
jgi:hypothetical protein